MTDGSTSVLAVINALGEGGTERSLADLIGPLAERGVDVTVATLRSRGDEGVEPRLRADGCEIVRLPAGRSRLPAFRRLVRDIRPQVLHSMLYEANILTRLGAVGTGVPVLTSLVNTSYSPERIATAGTSRLKVRLVQAVDTVTGRLLVDHFHAVSEAVKRAAVADLRIPPSRITVVPRGRADLRAGVHRDARARLRAELGIPSTAVVVLNPSRHEFQKDHRTLIRAMAPLLAETPDIWLVIAGREGAATATIVSERSALPDASRLLVLGHRGDIPELMAASDIVALTSRYEGMPGVVIEAMAMGRPVLASDIEPVREVVEVGASALVAPAGDVGAFTTALRTLARDPALRGRLGVRGRDLFDASFTIDRSADRMAGLYRLVTPS